VQAAQGRKARIHGAAVFATLLALVLPASASAGDSIFWGNESSGTIQVGNLDGSGSPSSPRSGEGGPCGVALDPAAGKIYWANFNGGEIQVANLDGSGPVTTLIGGQDNPCGVTVDPATDRIYWAEFCEIPGTTCGTIRGADLADVPGTAETLVPGEAGPSGVALDLAAGKIYWTNQSPAGTPPGSVRRANLDGSSPETVVGNQANPLGVAINAGKIYWTNLGSGAVRAADLADVAGTTTTLFSGENGPGGVAVGPTAGKIYWVTFFGGAVRVGNLDGTGIASTLGASFGGQSNPLLPALLHRPVGTGVPVISSGAGGELTCSQGTWAPDLLGAFLYRAPANFTYQWTKNGTTPVGTDSPAFEPTEAGDYTCTVTATNQAGEASQTSAAFNVPAQVPDVTTAPHFADHSPLPIDGAYPNFQAPVGAFVHDSATVGGTTNGTPTGTVEFRQFDNDDCSGAAADTETVALSGDAADQTNSYGPITQHPTLSFKAFYTSDNTSKWTNASSACEKLTVVCQVTFASKRTGNGDIYVIEDGAQTRLTTNPAVDGEPSFSQHARVAGKIDFVSNRAGDPDIFAMNASGAQWRLTMNAAPDSSPDAP
jgi:DNA-binding beta-propeller fold protein YncE